MYFKSKIILGAVILMALFSGAWSRGGEKIMKVADFPDTPEFEVLARDDRFPPRPIDQPKKVFIDLGYVWKQDKLLTCPVFNYKGHWVGYTGNGISYIPFKEAELQELAKNANIVIPESPDIPFWDAWGGKLALLVIIPVLLAIGYLWDLLWRYLKGEV
jgi:hypothetical protein